MSPITRYHSLDALRGLAALTVVVSHLSAYGLMSDKELWSILNWSSLRVLWGGHQAVILFFTLSGFSLYVMCERTSGAREYLSYAAARVIRLYPTYIMSILLAAVCLWATKPEFNPPMATLMGHISMIGTFDFRAINPPIWSITHEMRISLAFPIIFICALRFPVITLAITSAISISLAAALWIPSSIEGFIVNRVLSYAQTCHYTTMFVAGAVLAKYRGKMISSLSGAWNLRKTAMLIGCAILYMYPFDNPWNAGQRFAGDLAIMVGALGLMSMAMAHPGVLERGVFQYFGKISYSLYLTHNICLALVVWFVGADRPAVIWPLTVVMALPVAHLTYMMIEGPSQRWSRVFRQKATAGNPLGKRISTI